MRRSRLLAPTIAVAALINGCGGSAESPDVARNAEVASPPAQAQLQAAGATVGVGDRAPDFTLLDHHGKSVTLSEMRGQKVVLVFYRGHW